MFKYSVVGKKYVLLLLLHYSLIYRFCHMMFLLKFHLWGFNKGSSQLIKSLHYVSLRKIS